MQPNVTYNLESKIHLEVENGVMLVGWDGHYWPGAASTVHKAFVRFMKELKPKIVIYNGDAFVGAKISRYDNSSEVVVGRTA